MKFPIDMAGPCRQKWIVALFFFLVLVAGWGVAQERAPSAPLVDDRAELLSDKLRRELSRDLVAYRESTGCSIQVRTEASVDDRSFFRRSFGETWRSWGAPKCAVVFFLIREDTDANLMFTPAMQRRVLPEEVRAILLQVVVPRFVAEDVEGAVTAGVDSLKVALEGELEELPSPLRAQPAEQVRGVLFLLLGLLAAALSVRELLLAWRERGSASEGGA